MRQAELMMTKAYLCGFGDSKYGDGRGFIC